MPATARPDLVECILGTTGGVGTLSLVHDDLAVEVDALGNAGDWGWGLAEGFHAGCGF